MKKDEKEFLARYNIHDYDVPLVSVDVVVFTLIDDEIHLLLVKRADFPHKGEWALPGGFIDLKADASIAATAIRKLRQKTAVQTPYVEQIASIGGPDRDPRGWSVTILHMALIPHMPTQAFIAAVEDSQWWPYEKVITQSLAFDHNELVELARERLRSKTAYTTLPINLLAPPFTLTELQSAFEIVADTALDKKAFRRRLESADVLEEVSSTAPGIRGRPAVLYAPKKGFDAHVFKRVFGDPSDH